jgi:hypothetical protein
MPANLQMEPTHPMVSDSPALWRAAHLIVRKLESSWYPHDHLKKLSPKNPRFDWQF